MDLKRVRTWLVIGMTVSVVLSFATAYDHRYHLQNIETISIFDAYI